MGSKSKSNGDKVGQRSQSKHPRVQVGKFSNQAAADRAAKKIREALGPGALTITRRDGVEVWTVRKPTIN